MQNLLTYRTIHNMPNTAAHKRIDEGIKRGRRPRKPAPKRRDEITGKLQAVPPDLDPHQVLQLYLDADTSSRVADHLGIRRSTLTRWLRDTIPDEWRAAQIVRAHMRKEDGDEGIYGARDALDLARARELLRSGQWELERLDSENYGQKQEVRMEVEHRIKLSQALIDDAIELAARIRGVADNTYCTAIEPEIPPIPSDVSASD